MHKKDIAAVTIATIYLIIYCELLQFESMESAAMLMLLFSPAVITWMVYRVLKHGVYSGKELVKDEFGYADKNKDDLGVF